MPQSPSTTLGIAASISTSEPIDAAHAARRELAQEEPDRDRERRGDQHGHERGDSASRRGSRARRSWLVTGFQVWCQTNESPNVLDRGPGAVDDLVDDQADEGDRRRAPASAGEPRAARCRRCGRSGARRERERVWAAARHAGASMRAELYSRVEASRAAFTSSTPNRSHPLDPAPDRACATTRDVPADVAADRHRVEPAARRRARSRSARSSSASTTSASPTARTVALRASASTSTSNLITAVIGPSGLRQEHVHPLPEPDERPRPGRQGRRARSSTTARTSTAPEADPVEVRRRIGMVFQKPNPFPKSIYDNVAFAPKVLGLHGRHGRAGRARAPRAPRSGTRSRTG